MLRLGVHKGMEGNDYKGIEINGMEWNVFKQGKETEKNGMGFNEVTLIGLFKIKEQKGMKMNRM